MTTYNLKNARGNAVANQIVQITDNGKIFQSYDSIIVKIENDETFLDKKYWKWSATTIKNRCLFLGETSKETQAKIDSGEYKLVNLN